MYTVQRAYLQPFFRAKHLTDSCMILAQTRYTFSSFEPKLPNEAVAYDCTNCTNL